MSDALTENGAARQQNSSHHYLTDIAESLQKAVLQGNVEQAADLVSILARSRANVHITLERKEQQAEENIRVKVYLEDRVKSYPAPVILRVKPSTTVKELKSRMESNKIPLNIQRWVIGKRIATDNTTLSQCGIKTDDCSVFLYLMQNEPPTPPDALYQSLARGGVSNDKKEEPVYMSMHGATGVAQGPAAVNDPIYEEITSINVIPTKQPANLALPTIEPPPRKRPVVEEKPPEGWVCPACTLVNPPTRPGCMVCAADRPADYQVPDAIKYTDAELLRIAMERQEEQMFREIEQSGDGSDEDLRQKLYQALNINDNVNDAIEQARLEDVFEIYQQQQQRMNLNPPVKLMRQRPNVVNDYSHDVQNLDDVVYPQHNDIGPVDSQLQNAASTGFVYGPGQNWQQRGNVVQFPQHELAIGKEESVLRQAFENQEFTIAPSGYYSNVDNTYY